MITPNIVLRRVHFEQLLRESVPVHDLSGKLVMTVSLHPEAELIANLIAYADLTDPRGTQDARLRMIESPLRLYLDDPTDEKRDALQAAYDRTFTP